MIQFGEFVKKACEQLSVYIRKRNGEKKKQKQLGAMGEGEHWFDDMYEA